MTNKLYVVSTPIGNMGDMTIRAVEVLKTCGLILSEDTRETAKILTRFNISTHQISYRDQNHARIFNQILDVIKGGTDVALVSDSGTPLISDPGFKLVRDLIKHDIDIVAIPGPSAVISALTVSGLPTDKFTFLGFLPKSQKQVSDLLKLYGEAESTLIIYESPYRVDKLLSNIFETLGDRYVCVACELTKLHEKVLRGSVSQMLNTAPVGQNGKNGRRGEYVILVAKAGYTV